MAIKPSRIQRRLAEVGRIRLGEYLHDQGRPAKLNRMRFTSPDKTLLELVADAYGGQVDPWTPLNGGAAQWEVKITADRVPIIVPPRPYTQYMEFWRHGGCVRRCDAETETKTGKPCLCQSEGEEICVPYTRMSVMLRDIKGVGVWRLESHGEHAARELPDTLNFLAAAGRYVPTELHLVERRIIKDGKPRDIIIPRLHVDLSPGELISGDFAAEPQPIEPAARPALTAPVDPVAVLIEAIDRAVDRRELKALHKRAVGRNLSEAERKQVDAAAKARAAALDNAEVTRLWSEIVQAWPGEKITEIRDAFAARNRGLDPAEASPQQLEVFLKDISTGQFTSAGG